MDNKAEVTVRLSDGREFTCRVDLNADGTYDAKWVRAYVAACVASPA